MVNSQSDEGYKTYEFRTTTRISTQLNSGATAQVNVSIIQKTYVTIDSQGGEVVGPGIPPQPSTHVSVSVVGVQGKAAFNSSQKNTIRTVTQDIVEVVIQKNVDPKVAIALGIKESKLGIGRVAKGNLDENGKPYPWKLPEVNPLQLSRSSGLSPRAGASNRRYNISGALDVWKKFSGGRSFANTLKKFGGEGVRPSQRNYSNSVNGIYSRISKRTSKSTRCISGCR